MPTPPERTALYRLYDATQSQGIPPYLQELYPRFMPARHYLGMAKNDCRRLEGPGYYYAPYDWESDNVLGLELYVDWPTTPTALYRLRSGSNDLLYVGISGNPPKRWLQHAVDKPWWPQVDVSNSTTEWFGTRDEALAMEALAIKSERPLHNIVHNDDRSAA